MAPQDDASDPLARARRWRDHDPDPVTRAELTALLDAEDRAGLAAAFAGPLEFGTAGLRGRLGPGESRMNLATVLRATAGVAAHVRAHATGPWRVVLGCDARHGSAAFQAAAAEVVSAAGGEALLLPAALPTPVTAHLTRVLPVDAGVMITASHNPPADNGYKVYLGRALAERDSQVGAQITAPHDRLIAEAIAAAPPADEVPRDDSRIRRLGPGVLEDYLDRAASLARVSDPAARGGLRIALTPLHGVGGAPIAAALARAGFTSVHPVAAQFDPDPDFPTVEFPNPEEPGALDLALTEARRIGADLVLAADPDADRCAAAIADGAAAGGYRLLSGDELGAVLAEYLAREHAGEHGASLANSMVSSRLPARIAAAHGLGHVETLTGFKWISQAPGIVYGYEEAIGYCVDPGQVRDKDGVSAAVRVADIAAALAAAGRDLGDVLDDLARAHGLHLTRPLTVRVADTSRIAAAMARLRQSPPEELAGSPVTGVRDYATGADGLPATDAVGLTTAADDRVIARPSGTEPKLKCYLEVIVDVAGGEVAAARARANARLDAIAATMRDALGL